MRLCQTMFIYRGRLKLMMPIDNIGRFCQMKTDGFVNREHNDNTNKGEEIAPCKGAFPDCLRVKRQYSKRISENEQANLPGV